MDGVPFLDVGAGYRELRDELDAAYRKVMEGGWYVLGPEVEAFEHEWAEACGSAWAVGLASGSDALLLTLRALGIGPGDEVLVPSNTYVATWLAVSAAGATPVAVEPDPATQVVAAEAMAAGIGSRTAALLPVHLYGVPVDAPAMEALAADRGLALVFDAAHAHGARVDGRPVGGFGHASAWSFYPAKNLGAFGDAGAVTTDDEQLARRLRRLRNYGSEEKYLNLERGANSRLDELQAALLRVKLARLDDWNARRAGAADHYLEDLRGADVVLPQSTTGVDRSWHLFVVRSAHRDALQQRLRQRGVETLIHYPVPPHLQAAYADLGCGHGALPIAERLAAEVLSLPLGPHLTRDQQDRVIDAVRWPRDDRSARAPTAR